MVSTRDNSATTESRNQADDVEAGWYVLGDDIGFDDVPFIEVAMGECGTPSFDSIAYVQADFYSEADDEWEITERTRSRARLIASAPDLLAALIGMADAYVALLLIKAEDPSRFKEPGSPYANALAAISKATGAQS